jgi:1-acyl-sn-glycerol-3-phosphate acyltransferase
MLQVLRGWIRFAGIPCIVLYYIVPLMLRSKLLGEDLTRGFLVRRQCALSLVKWLGVRIEWEGAPVDEVCTYVGNHRSYLDPVVACCKLLAMPVAKAEVGNWPLIGLGIRVTGILLVQRDNKSSRSATRSAMEAMLRQGHSVLIYPEGTTHTDATTRPLSKGTFVLAADLGVPVVPIAIEYQDPEDAWVGDDTFVRHFLQCFGKRHTCVRIRFGEPIRQQDSEALLLNCQQWLDDKLRDMRHDWLTFNS